MNKALEISQEYKNQLHSGAVKFLNAKEKRRIAVDRLIAIQNQVLEYAGGSEVTTMHWMECGLYALAQKLQREIQSANRTMRKFESDHYYAKTYGVIA